MPDYNEKHYSADSIIPHKNAPPRFDFERLTRFMSYGFIMSPVQFQWYGFLSRVFPITKQSAAIPALKRVAFDQLIFAPIGRSLLIFAEEKKAQYSSRTGLLFHIHDGNRGRWKTRSFPQVSRSLSAIVKSELHAMANCSITQLQGYPVAIPDCQYNLCHLC